MNAKIIMFYSGNAKAYDRSYYGQALNDFVINEINCTGREIILASCKFLTDPDWIICGTGEAAGVACSNSRMYQTSYNMTGIGIHRYIY